MTNVIDCTSDHDSDIADDNILRTARVLKEKRHRGERWSDSREGVVLAESHGEHVGVSGRKGTKRQRRTNVAIERNGQVPLTSEKPQTSKSRIDDGGPLDTSAESLAACEGLAKAAVESGDFSFSSVLRVLRALEVPANFTRKNVIPVGAEYVRGMLLGLYSYGGTVGISAKTTQHPWLTRLLIGSIRAVDLDFPFTSIQLNYNYASRPHVDKNNMGTSLILGLGNYSGGELWVHDEEGNDMYTLDGDDDVTGFYHVGRKLKGQKLDIRERWRVFDGTKLHFTTSFVGERYSVIFFTSDRYAAAAEHLWPCMQAYGFDFDSKADNLGEFLADKHRRRVQIAKQVVKERAKEEQQKLLSRGRCIGRVWARGWGLRCTAVCAPGSELCGTHQEKDRWKTHGRMDGPVPEKKRDEMAFWQRKNLEAGKRPPERDSATILVPIQGWPETSYLQEQMQTYGEYRLMQPARKLNASIE